MIYIDLHIKNPRSTIFRNIKSWYGSTFIPHKNWELEFYRSANIIGFSFNFTIHQDHAGLSTSISFLSYGLGFHVYDGRHWNHETEDWY